MNWKEHCKKAAFGLLTNAIIIHMLIRELVDILNSAFAKTHLRRRK